MTPKPDVPVRPKLMSQVPASATIVEKWLDFGNDQTARPIGGNYLM
jgi:hypothetical protein